MDNDEIDRTEATSPDIEEMPFPCDAQRWRAENAAAVRSYNERVETGAILSNFGTLFA